MGNGYGLMVNGQTSYFSKEYSIGTQIVDSVLLTKIEPITYWHQHAWQCLSW